ncbi:MAG: GNAT family N-acetyltransferase [Alphaproteobacteria bacterium]|nr:MAG: GNAT family N-acetyltransferase [Alphaproteobacteria bacterium]
MAVFRAAVNSQPGSLCQVSKSTIRRAGFSLESPPSRRPWTTESFLTTAPTSSTTQLLTRPACLEDLEALVTLEEVTFEKDRLSRRNLRHLLTSPTARCLVAEAAGQIVGYAVLLFRQGTAVARLYSIAVDPSHRGRGVARRLLDEAEQIAFDRDCLFLRLEVRADNQRAIDLYKRQGYRQFGRYLDYYLDHTDALRFEKRLSGHVPAHVTSPPYYPQTTDFTCGPATMIMALAGFDPGLVVDRSLELRLWRESTTIFMTGGLGGCEPYGMAVALARHGASPEVWVNSDALFFLDSVRNPAKRDVMRVTQMDFRAAASALHIPVRRRVAGKRSLLPTLTEGARAIVLISGYRMLRERTPHWILAYGADDHHVYVHDPWVGEENLETAVAAAKLPIPWAEFERMARYGRDRRSAVIIVRKERKP